MDEKLLFSQQINLELKSIKVLRDKLKIIVFDFDRTGELGHQLIIVIHEWLVNLKQHSQSVPENVIIEISSKNKSVLFMTIKDDGSSFHDFASKIKTANIEIPDHESGRGLYLLDQLFDDVHYGIKNSDVQCYNELSFSYDLMQ